MWTYSYQGALGYEHLRCGRLNEPEPGPNDLVLEMLAAAVNYRDLAIADGVYHVDVSPPLVPLSDGAGRVVRRGPAVTRFSVGDLVCPLYLPNWIDGPITRQKAARRLGGPDDGVYRQFMCVNEEEVVRAPRHLDPGEAATLPVAALTAWHALFAQGNLQYGMTLLVQGAGGVSSFAIQFGKLAGARVVVLVRSEAASDVARGLGADDVLVMPDPKQWPAGVRRIVPEGVDRVLDITGAEITASIACCRGEAIVHIVGYTGGTRASLDIFTAIRHAVTLRAASAGHRASFEQMVRAMESASIRPLIGATFARDQFGDALAALRRKGRTGKITLELTEIPSR